VKEIFGLWAREMRGAVDRRRRVLAAVRLGMDKTMRAAFSGWQTLAVEGKRRALVAGAVKARFEKRRVVAGFYGWRLGILLVRQQHAFLRRALLPVRPVPASCVVPESSWKARCS
jgi:hypothetical protein